MSDDYRPPMADYFDELEARYGADFMFDRLADEELMEFRRLAREAVERDPKVTAEEKKALTPLVELLDRIRIKRGLTEGH
jgi:hypothetical protein